MSDTPIHTDGSGRWCISSPAGREIAVGQAFDGNHGHRVTLKFSGSSRWNSLSVEAARSVVADMRGQGARNADAIALAAEIGRWADHCDRLNAGWLVMGSPAGGFDAMAHGNA
jgi:hypothetical protein